MHIYSPAVLKPWHPIRQARAMPLIRFSLNVIQRLPLNEDLQVRRESSARGTIPAVSCKAGLKEVQMNLDIGGASFVNTIFKGQHTPYKVTEVKADNNMEPIDFVDKINFSLYGAPTGKLICFFDPRGKDHLTIIFRLSAKTIDGAHAPDCLLTIKAVEC